MYAQANTSAYLQAHLEHETHRTCTFKISQCAVVYGRQKGEKGRKVKHTLFSTFENELKLFLVPAAAYNGKNEDWLLPEKWVVRNNRCEISATSLAISVVQFQSQGPSWPAAFSEARLIFELLNCSPCLSEFTQ